MKSSFHRGLMVALVAAASIAGCKCGSKVVGPGCHSDEECITQHENVDRWYCDVKQNPPQCALTPKQCETASDCCPGQICNVQGHFCVDKFTPCAESGSCPAPGQVCKTIGYFPSGLGCTYDACNPDGSCATQGTSCFNGFCVGEPPCSPGCAAGKVCVTKTNLCSPAPADASCSQSCPSGKILVLSDPNNVFDSCHAPDTCACQSLPPIQVRDVSRFSSIGAYGSELYVSAYDGEHGDLVVHTYDRASMAKPKKSEWIDGVPATGHIGGDTSGPRGGITDPGPNVGQYTSLAVSAQGDVYVAYYDVDNGDLKFTARYGGSSAAWITPITIDGANNTGDVGMYASIAVDNLGRPAIAYFQRGSWDATAGAETGNQTALVYAYANKAQPLVAADWSVVGKVETATRPDPPCKNACTSAQICVVDAAAPNGERCATKTAADSQCTHLGTTPPQPPGCTGNQACVLDSNAANPPLCLETKAAAVLPELPVGTGLMPSLAFVDSHPVIAYYDSMKQAVKAVLGTGSGTMPAFSAPVEIDGDDATGPKRDTGRWPSVAVGPSSAAGGRIAIAFGDRTSQQLLLYQSNALIAHAQHGSVIHLVDDGKWTPDQGAWHPQTFPGAQVSIGFTPSGKIALAYQDATPVDLIYSVWDPATNARFSRTPLRTAGAAGFWPRLAIVNGQAFVSSASIKASTPQIPFNQLAIDTASAP